ncbi:MAG: hypothetical protein P3B98_01805 [Gemmatimonadota bacterium]|nr:hypothetical protein [Gemmatimonadota bacterium]
MSRTTSYLASLFLATAAGCASSSSSTTVAPPTTISPMTQRVVTPNSSLSINTISLNSGSNTLIVAPIEATWTALNLVYSEFGIPITTLVDAQHLIGNDAFKVRRRINKIPMQNILDCGNAQGIPNAETYDIMMSISSTLAANPKGGTNLLTRIDASGKSPNFSRDQSVTCASSGELEKQIAEAVRKKTGN